MSTEPCPACAAMLRDLTDARQQVGLLREEIRTLRAPRVPLTSDDLMLIAAGRQLLPEYMK